ncbi:hypothetical protein QPK31_23270 [Massilia sp. YIM B02769]|uniref:hypothetical protein n=1 Tax=Massilia sp. YIM B02769 TaxID=3050129 RepID=UPI0025B72D9E|nr:hypothetical protein [Massilia sp. YIM B02769]MDN4061144.1 hypothetical protein [Massilia sp. YIM B02769]
MAKKAPGAPAPEPVVQPEQEQAPAPEPVVPAADPPAVPPEPVQPPAEVEPLATYAARIEEAAQPLPVCQITHPDAKDGAIHVGKYAGIRLVHGDTPAALLSDGTTI